jgi:hypothetical protein
MATVASHKRLYTHYQCNVVDNHTYMSFVEMIETCGGVSAVQVIPTFLDEKIKELATEGRIIDPLNPMDAEQAMAVNLVRGEYLGALMPSGANCNHFSLLRTVS